MEVKSDLKESDLVLCTVKSIQGTSVFLQIEGNGEGSLILPEIAAGRIRNLREYVAPNKKIVCKILKIQDGNIQLSLRRVTAKEKQEVLEKYKKEQTFKAILRTVTSDFEEIIDKIREKHELHEFFDKIKEDVKHIYSFFKGEEAKKLEKLILEKREKPKEVKRLFILKSDSESGLLDIKSILNIENAEIKYLGSSRFEIRSQGKDFKEANHKLDLILKAIEQKAKDKKAFFELKEK